MAAEQQATHNKGGHRVRVTPIEVDARRGRHAVTALTARLTAAIEGQIRDAPAEWVWWHERWRRRPPAPPSVAAPDVGARAMQSIAP